MRYRILNGRTSRMPRLSYCYFCREDEAPLICNRGGFAAVADTAVIIIARRRVAQLDRIRAVRLAAPRT